MDSIFENNIKYLKQMFDSLNVDSRDYFIGDPSKAHTDNLHVLDLTLSNPKHFDESPLDEQGNYYLMYSLIHGKKYNIQEFNKLHVSTDYFFGLVCFYHFIKEKYPNVPLSYVLSYVNKTSLKAIVNKLGLTEYCYWGRPNRSVLNDYQCFDDTESDKGIWRCFHFERGGEHFIQKFTSEKKACYYFLGMMTPLLPEINKDW